MNRDPVTGAPTDQVSDCKVRDFYDRQVLENPELPAMLGVANRLAADLRDYEEWRTFRKLISLHRDMHVLELGCGGGRWCEHLAPQVGTVTGVDFSANALAHARKRAEAGQLRNIVYCESSVEDFQPDRPYDLIYFSGVSPYLDDIALVDSILRYGRYLKDGGTILLRDSVSDMTHSFRHREGYTSFYRSLADLTSQFGVAGFELVRYEKAFRRFCLASVFSSRYLYGLYKTLPDKRKREMVWALSSIASLLPDSTHWPGETYSYDHLFLVFTRIH